jgi:hypothetical protein
MLRLLGDAESAKLAGGAAVTVKVTGLLLFMMGATETAKGPEVAPGGMVMVIDVAPQELMVAKAPFSVTMLLPWEFPKPDPEMVTGLPTAPAVADMLVITGAGTAVELTDTLSKVVVASAELLLLLTAKPM